MEKIMAEYIDKEELLKKIGSFPLSWEYGQAVEQIYEIVENEEPADVAPVVHAHWILNTDDFTPKKRCEHCGYNKPIPAGERIQSEPENYCPHCGAKMDKKE